MKTSFLFRVGGMGPVLSVFCVLCAMACGVLVCEAGGSPGRIAFHFESTGAAGGKPDKLVWETESGVSYDLWRSGKYAASLRTWTRVDGFPKTATGSSMEHVFDPDRRAFFKIIAETGALEEFARVPAGSFEMGGQLPGSVADETPVHDVEVAGFYLGRWEVTKGLWDKVRAWGAKHGYTDLPNGGGVAPDRPVYGVSWHDAVKWCNARSEMEGLPTMYWVWVQGPTGIRFPITYRTGAKDAVNCNWKKNGYRLPTEAEWEKAARGGLAGKRFPWGDTITHSQANYFSTEHDDYDISPTRGFHPVWGTNVWPYTAPVGSFAPNGFGLFDMAGNSGEWCWDWYSDTYYGESSASDPLGPNSGTERVWRSGAFNLSAARFVRCAFRKHAEPAISNDYTGFRLARRASVWIEQKSFQMGDVADGTSELELPTHSVTVSGFFMDPTEVTKSLWDKVRAWGLGHGYSDLPEGFAKGPDHPVVHISWYDAVKWCNARSEMEGEQPCYKVRSNPLQRPFVYRNGEIDAVICYFSNRGYRLPTEAEWERAARSAYSGKRFPWGDTITHSQANYFSTEHDDYDISPTSGYHPDWHTGANPFTSVVGSFPANGSGLFDMAGNAKEWCWDWFGNYASGSQTDPAGPDTGTKRIVRGGSFSDSANKCRVSYRSSSREPGYKVTSLGFRCVHR
jgi:formylglycine-generating enzyme required for sulfatase activity